MSELELAPGTISVDQLLKLCANPGVQLSLRPRDNNAACSNASRTTW